MKRFFKSNLLKAALVFSLISVGIELLQYLIAYRFDFSNGLLYEELGWSGLLEFIQTFLSGLICYAISESLKLDKLGISLLRVLLFSFVILIFDFLEGVILYWVYALPDIKVDFYLIVRAIPRYLYTGFILFFVILHFREFEKVHTD
jgi:hypothetical protein